MNININNIGTTHKTDTVNGSNLTYGYPQANKRTFAVKCVLSKTEKNAYSNTRLEDERLAKVNRVNCLKKQKN